MMREGAMVSRLSENLSSVFFGWTVALTLFTSHRIISSWSLSRRKGTTFSWYLSLCTMLVVSSAILAILSWVYLIGRYRPGQLEFAAFLTLWTLEAQVYFQILVWRTGVLSASNRRDVLRVGVALLVLPINISMYSLWLPGRLDPQATVSSIAFWWPRVEKIFYILVDLGLNGAFLYLVKKKLIHIGLVKYRRLVIYNLQIIFLSMLLDAMLLGLQWYPNNAEVFIIVHPVCYMSKLVLELSICEKMADVSREVAVSNSVRDYPSFQRFSVRHNSISSASPTLSSLYAKSFSKPNDGSITAEYIKKARVYELEDKALPPCPRTKSQISVPLVPAQHKT